MKEKIMLGDFICELRKAKNLSQFQLGQLVGVSNKAVSKWETYESNPELSIVPKLASVLGVTTDELLACKKSEIIGGEETQVNNKTSDNSASVDYCYMGLSFLRMRGESKRTAKSYEFISHKKTRKGTPYVHVNLGKDENGKAKRAKGIVAIGNISSGLVSIGMISCGLVSLGLLSLGLISLGILSIGLLASVGLISLGTVSVGAVSVGVIAVGAVSIGYLSLGGVSVGYFAHTGIHGVAIGKHIFFH